MLDNVFVVKLKKVGIFVLAFTLLFVLFFYTLKFTLPFVLGFLIALSTKRFNLFLQKRLKLTSGISSIFTTTLVFAVLSTIVTLLVYKATTETILLLANIPDLETMAIYIDKLIVEITELVGQIDPLVVTKVYEYLQTLLSRLFNFAIIALNGILAAALRLPKFLLITVITFISTYQFSKDFKLFSGNFYSIFSGNGKTKMQSIIESSITMTVSYAKAYSLVVFITFVEVLIGLSMLKIQYALILSILCAIFDVLPIIGISMVFIPLVIYNFYIGNAVIAIGLIVLYIVVIVVRQIIEPKIVAHTLDIHPLLILAAIFIGFMVNGFAGMIYFISLMVAYKILVKVNVL